MYEVHVVRTLVLQLVRLRALRVLLVLQVRMQRPRSLQLQLLVHRLQPQQEGMLRKAVQASLVPVLVPRLNPKVKEPL